MRLCYLGTPEMAVAPLRALVAAGHEIVLVVTGADRRRGRGTSTSPSPVKAAAGELGLEVAHDLDAVDACGAELGVVVAYGRIIPGALLERLPMINLHFSLLPRWRGAAPVERALLAGDEMTGVCVMELESGLDTGAVYARRDLPIGPRTTAAALRADLVAAGVEVLVETLSPPLGEPVPQIGASTYAAKLTPSDLRIDWSAPTAEIDRLIRVGGAWTTFRGDRIKVHTADLVDGEIVPTVVQPAGKPAMDASSWRNGARPGPDERFE